jgi:predicted ATPase
VFDNCEHVVHSVAELVEAILGVSATVTILATSRERLGVSEEQLWRVPSLDVNSGADSAAVTLFVEHLDEVEKVLLERCSVFAGGSNCP